MEAIPIPDEEIPERGERIVMAPPSGDLTDDEIRPAEALVTIAELYDQPARLYSFLIHIDDDEVGPIAAERRFWLHQWTGVMPFALSPMLEPDGATPRGAATSFVLVNRVWRGRAEEAVAKGHADLALRLLRELLEDTR